MIRLRNRWSQILIRLVGNLTHQNSTKKLSSYNENWLKKWIRSFRTNKIQSRSRLKRRQVSNFPAQIHQKISLWKGIRQLKREHSLMILTSTSAFFKKLTWWQTINRNLTKNQLCLAIYYKLETSKFHIFNLKKNLMMNFWNR